MGFTLQVNQHYRPFSKTAGQSFWIPGTDKAATIFPNKLVIGDEFVLEIPLSARARSFEAYLDLKKGIISVYIKEKQYWRFIIKTKTDGISIHFERAPEGFERDYFIPSVVKKLQNPELLSCGVYKKQEWEKITKRALLKEILPLWFLASQWYEGHNRKTEDLIESFFEEFSGVFIPQKKAHSHDSLRRLFVTDTLELLPTVLTDCGRVKGLKCRLALVDLEWRSWRLQKAIIQPFEDVSFSLPKAFKTCRVRKQRKERGIILKKGQILSLEKGIRVFLDRFTQ